MKKISIKKWSTVFSNTMIILLTATHCYLFADTGDLSKNANSLNEKKVSDVLNISYSYAREYWDKDMCDTNKHKTIVSSGFFYAYGFTHDFPGVRDFEFYIFLANDGSAEMFFRKKTGWIEVVDYPESEATALEAVEKILREAKAKHPVPERESLSRAWRVQFCPTLLVKKNRASYTLYLTEEDIIPFCCKQEYQNDNGNDLCIHSDPYEVNPRLLLLEEVSVGTLPDGPLNVPKLLLHYNQRVVEEGLPANCRVKLMCSPRELLSDRLLWRDIQLPGYLEEMITLEAIGIDEEKPLRPQFEKLNLRQFLWMVFRAYVLNIKYEKLYINLNYSIYSKDSISPATMDYVRAVDEVGKDGGGGVIDWKALCR